MSTVTLRIKTPLGMRIDGSNLLPAPLSAMTDGEIAKVLLRAGNETFALGNLFDVKREESEAPHLVIEGDARRIDRLGANMTEGVLIINGAAGDYAGFRMAGGELNIAGDAGRFVGCEMSGGQLNVTGSVGDFAAGALPGDMEGMTGGRLTIRGNAGARLADRMRRGLVLVGGDAGDFAASRMVAGTVCVAGKVGAHYGYGMRRGTLLLMREPECVPPTFTEGGHGFDVFWSLFVRSLGTTFAPFSALDSRVPPRRHAGDLAVDGRGELLIAQSAQGVKNGTGASQVNRVS